MKYHEVYSSEMQTVFFELEKASSYREFELLRRVKLYRKLPEGKRKLVRVSGRIELARVRVIGSRLYF